MNRRMSSKQRMRYFTICFAIFAVLLIYNFFNNRGSVDKSARQFCIYAVSEEAAEAFEAADYSDEIFDAFLNDSFTDAYYERFIADYNQLDPEADAAKITADRIRTDARGCADELLRIYNALKNVDAGEMNAEETGTEAATGDSSGQEKADTMWVKLRRDTFEKTLSDFDGVMPYETIVRVTQENSKEK